MSRAAHTAIRRLCVQREACGAGLKEPLAPFSSVECGLRSLHKGRRPISGQAARPGLMISGLDQERLVASRITGD